MSFMDSFLPRPEEVGRPGYDGAKVVKFFSQPSNSQLDFLPQMELEFCQCFLQVISILSTLYAHRFFAAPYNEGVIINFSVFMQPVDKSEQSLRARTEGDHWNFGQVVITRGQ